MRDSRLPARLLAVLALTAALAAGAPAAAEAQVEGTEDVLLVGNNWDGTADVVDPKGFKRLTRINIVPDLAARRVEIAAARSRSASSSASGTLIGEGHDQLVDDMFTSLDGRFLYVSRPSLADVVAFDLRTRRIAWRVRIEGYRADHMAISPDGRRLLVSASTARKVHAIDTARDSSSASSSRATSRTRTTTRATADGSTTPASARVFTPATTLRSTRRRAIATSRWSTRAPTGSSSASTSARRSRTPAIPT